MVRMLTLAAVAALLATSQIRGTADATATLSNAAAGARPVALTLVLRSFDLRCGRLNARSLTIRLPRALRVPRSIAPAAVQVSGEAVTSVRTRRSRIVISPAGPKGITCDSIGPGSVRIELTRAAGLGNPVRPGTYRFTVRAAPRAQTWHGSFVVR